MPDSVSNQEFLAVLRAAQRASLTRETQSVTVDGESVRIPPATASPQDWRDVVVYQVLVDRFCNPTPGAKPAAPPPAGKGWDDPACDAFQGGTIEGVRSKLGYLRDLGVGAIWLSPVLATTPDAAAYHGYGIQDFLRVDPRFGTDQDLRRLVDEAHARGLYVLLDVVLNHAGNVFSYVLDNGDVASQAPFRKFPYPVQWHDATGKPDSTLTDLRNVPSLPRRAAVWPRELQSNDWFRRMGVGGEGGGDFLALKEFVTAFPSVRDVLIKVHQYLVARFDVDGFRIDTLKYVERDFAQDFCNAMREYGLSIGKKNLETFGEVWDGEEKIAAYIGRNASDPDELVGADAALDFPLFYALTSCVKGFAPPTRLADVFTLRKAVQKGVLSSHGEAGRYFVTFLANHDQTSRFYCGNPRYLPQVSMGVALQFALQGTPCLYYGTEQDLAGSGSNERAVREPLWPAFQQNGATYRAIHAIAQVRATRPALRYGRQYFRQVSEDGSSFAVSQSCPGVIAFSRICSAEEVIAVANTSDSRSFQGYVVVDRLLTPVGTELAVLYSNVANPTAPRPAVERRDVSVRELDGTVTGGPVTAVQVKLEPLEVELLGAKPLPVS